VVAGFIVGSPQNFAWLWVWPVDIFPNLVTFGLWANAQFATARFIVAATKSTKFGS